MTGNKKICIKRKKRYCIVRITSDTPDVFRHAVFGLCLEHNQLPSKSALRREHPVFRGDGLSGSIEASVAMHGVFLYAVFFNSFLAALGPGEGSLALSLFLFLSSSLRNLPLSPPSSSSGEPPRFFPSSGESSPSLRASTSRSPRRLFLRLPVTSTSLSSALLFPALVGKPSGPFARRSPLARAAGRHIIFSVFLLRGNLSSGEPVERWRWQRPRR